jgi:hypothetical protein
MMAKVAKVVSLWPAIAPPTPVVQPALVEQLEALLKLAKDGHLKGIAYATVEGAGGIGTSWVGDCDRALTIAGVRILEDRIMVAYRDK